MNIYCPSCGEWFVVENIGHTIAPGELLAKCSNCGNKYQIKIEFYELEEKGEKDGK